jgi:GPI mannosyltransferase 1 subunit M
MHIFGQRHHAMHMFKSFDHVPSFRTVLLASAALRVALILYSEWYDALPDTVVKYTDIDYRVFSDASSFLWNPSVEIQNVAKGPLGWTWLGECVFHVYSASFHAHDIHDSPYTRKTYRYTPLLAVILAPNEWLHPSFGKYLFAACDILNGVLLHSMLLAILSWPVVARSLKASASKRETKESAYSGTRTATRASLATLYTSIHLFNPLVFTISTRGSSEALLSTLVLFTLWCALEGKWDAAAVGLGFATHWKIYPVIYGVSCLGVVGAGSEEGWRRLVNRKTVRFGVLSAGTFALLGVGCYVLYSHFFLLLLPPSRLTHFVQVGVSVLIRDVPLSPTQARPSP